MNMLRVVAKAAMQPKSHPNLMNEAVGNTLIRHTGNASEQDLKALKDFPLREFLSEDPNIFKQFLSPGALDLKNFLGQKDVDPGVLNNLFRNMNLIGGHPQIVSMDRGSRNPHGMSPALMAGYNRETGTTLVNADAFNHAQSRMPKEKFDDLVSYILTHEGAHPLAEMILGTGKGRRIKDLPEGLKDMRKLLTNLRGDKTDHLKDVRDGRVEDYTVRPDGLSKQLKKLSDFNKLATTKATKAGATYGSKDLEEEFFTDAITKALQPHQPYGVKLRPQNLHQAVKDALGVKIGERMVNINHFLKKRQSQSK